MQKWGERCLAALFSLTGIDPAQALDFNFSWTSTSGDSTSPAFPGTGIGIASGSFTVNKNAGESFTGTSDLSDISVTFFDGENSFSRTSAEGFLGNFTAGTISGDGSSIAFSNFGFQWNDGGNIYFGCNFANCSDSNLRLDNLAASYSISYSSPANALASLSATPSTPVPFELNPNSGILILMGLWGTNKVIQRQKKSKLVK